MNKKLHFVATCSTAIFAICGIAHAASPDAWAAHYKDVVSSCTKASGLRNAGPAGNPVDFDDRVGYTAIVIQGHYPQPHMKNQSGRVLCLFEKRSRTPYISEANAIITTTEEERAQAVPPPPVPTPVPRPTPSIAKKVKSIEEVDFANFTFPPVEDCGKNPASLKFGKYEDEEVHVQLTPERVSPGGKVIYADLTGQKMNQAIVPLYCDTRGNFFITEIFLYALRNGEPVLIAKLPESIMERDYRKYYPVRGTWGGISRVAANNGKIIFYKLADGYHACPKNDVRFEYALKGNSFVLAGKPVKRPNKNC